MAENINLSLSKDFSESSLPVNYAKGLINTKNPDENKKKCSQDKRQNIRFKRQNKKMSKRAKPNKSVDETLRINEGLKKLLHVQKLIKENQNQNLMKVLQIG